MRSYLGSLFIDDETKKYYFLRGDWSIEIEIAKNKISRNMHSKFSSRAFKISFFLRFSQNISPTKHSTWKFIRTKSEEN